MASFNIGERVIASVDFLPVGPFDALFRGEVTHFYMDGGIEYVSVITDQGEGDAFPNGDGLFREGELIPIVSGNGLEEFQANAENSSLSLYSGDAGQIVIEGFGAGALSLVPGVRTTFANEFITQGMILAGITGDGFNKFIVHWEIPQEIIPSSYQPAVIAVPIVIIAQMILKALVPLVISYVAFQLPKIFMSLKATPGSPAKPALQVRNGESGLDHRVMVRRGDGSLVPPDQVCDDPSGCTILAEPAVEGTSGIIRDLKPLIWGAGILVGGLVVVNILNAIPRRRK